MRTGTNWLSEAALPACLRGATQDRPLILCLSPASPWEVCLTRTPYFSQPDVPHRIPCESQLKSWIPQGGWRVWELLDWEERSAEEHLAFGACECIAELIILDQAQVIGDIGMKTVCDLMCWGRGGCRELLCLPAEMCLSFLQSDFQQRNLFSMLLSSLPCY